MTSSIVLPLLAVLAVAALLFLTIAPRRYRPRTRTNVHFERALAFAVTGFLVVASFPGSQVVSGMICVVAAGLSELLQMLVPSRHPGVKDAIAKGVGAAIGAAVAILLSGR